MRQALRESKTEKTRTETAVPVFFVSDPMIYCAKIPMSSLDSHLRLGDDIDDYCVKCKRVTNHVVVSMVGDKAAKVRCRSCYSEHDFRNLEIPPSKRDLKKQALFNEVLDKVNPGAGKDSAEDDTAEIDASDIDSTEIDASEGDSAEADRE
jgi:hypothetical protein